MERKCPTCDLDADATFRAAMHVARTALDSTVSEATLTALYSLFESLGALDGPDVQAWGQSVASNLSGAYFIPRPDVFPMEPSDAEPEPFDPR